ncbi:Hypothetical protein CINCED_3A023417 [Cinara cedri]|uniref:Uncharacterized protein n=1 Tax=Cinara cedri TaxID=506608 RepID=A0A5E4N245_9HEMI|nr:Hypothetical protein CINCED_3A023417 [Cinara cedri]
MLTINIKEIQMEILSPKKKKKNNENSYTFISSLNKHKKKGHSVKKDVFNTKTDTKPTQVNQNTLLLENKCKKLKKKNQNSNKLLTINNTISINDIYTIEKNDDSKIYKGIFKPPSTGFSDFNENKNQSHSTS